MKKLLLTGIAALSLLYVVGVQTFATTVELPDEMDHLAGAWCTLSLEKPEPGERSYGKHQNEENEEDDECGKDGGIFIWDTGYRYFSPKGDAAICEFTAIQFSRHEGDPGEDDYDVYEVHAKCRSVEDGNVFSEHFEISSSEGALIQQFLPES